MVAIHEGMTARDVCVMLAERNHQDLGPNWTIVEKIPDLHLGEIRRERGVEGCVCVFVLCQFSGV